MQAQQGSSLRFFGDLVAVFAVLSVADLYLTWKLIDVQQSEVIESNPLASRILQEFGWAGLSVFKSAMVVGVAGLAVTVMRRCQRRAELLMVFGCGAQGAIVATSILLCTHAEAAMPEPDPISASPLEVKQAQPLPLEAMRLLALPAVQQEVQLSAAQIGHFRELEAYRRELRRVAGNADLIELNMKLTTVSSQEFLFVSQLTPIQEKRLKQLAWQYRGSLALADDDIAELLDFSGEQAETAQAIGGRIADIESRRGSSSPREIEESLAACREELGAMLSSAQKARWARLQGEPFAFEKIPAMTPHAE